VEAPDEPTFSLGSGGPESVLAGRLWRISVDDNQQLQIESGPDDSTTGTLGAHADAHTESGSDSRHFQALTARSMTLLPFSGILGACACKQCARRTHRLCGASMRRKRQWLYWRALFFHR
jgi:hypothetical protein